MSCNPSAMDEHQANNLLAGKFLLQLETIFEARRDPRMRPGHIGVLLALIEAMDIGTFTVSISPKTLSAMTGASMSRVYTVLGELRKCGYTSDSSGDITLTKVKAAEVRRKLQKVAEDLRPILATAWQAEPEVCHPLASAQDEVASQRQIGEPRTCQPVANTQSEVASQRQQSEEVATAWQKSGSKVATTWQDQALNGHSTTHSSSISEKERVSDLPLDITLHSVGSDDIRDATDEFNAMAKRCSLSVVKRLNDQRRKALATILEQYGREDWREALKQIEGSDFLRGIKTNSGWRVDFDWATNLDHFVKIIEGKYRNRVGSNDTPAPEYFPDPKLNPDNWPDPYGDD